MSPVEALLCLDDAARSDAVLPARRPTPEPTRRPPKPKSRDQFGISHWPSRHRDALAAEGGPMRGGTTVPSHPMHCGTSVPSHPMRRGTTVPSHPMRRGTSVPSQPMRRGTTVPSHPMRHGTIMPSHATPRSDCGRHRERWPQRIGGAVTRCVTARQEAAGEVTRTARAHRSHAGPWEPWRRRAKPRSETMPSRTERSRSDASVGSKALPISAVSPTPD